MENKSEKLHRDPNKYSSGLDMSVRPKSANKDQDPHHGPGVKTK